MVTTVPTSPLTSLKDPASLEVSGVWKGVTAGGTVMNKETWKNNPQFAFTLTKTMKVTLCLSQSGTVT